MIMDAVHDVIVWDPSSTCIIPSEARFPLEVLFELAWLPKFQNVALDYHSTSRELTSSLQFSNS